MNSKKNRITGFAGSNSSQSINRKLVQYALDSFKDDETELLDLNDFEMPLYSKDREKEIGIPEKAHLFRRKMHEANAVICSMAENNRSYTAAFKNILDWCSRIDLNIYGQNPMLLMSTSPGKYGGQNVMNTAKSFFPKCGAEIIETFSLPSFYENFKEGKITDEALKDELLSKIESFKSSIQHGKKAKN